MNPADLPVLRLKEVLVEHEDGSSENMPVPPLHPKFGWPMTHEKRLPETRMERVRKITATLEYQEPGGVPEYFSLDARLYSDLDHEHQVVMTTRDLDMGARELIETAGLRNHPSGIDIVDAMEWMPEYHARRLSGENPDQVNRETLAKIAAAIEDIGVTPGPSEISAAAPKGEITITLRMGG